VTKACAEKFGDEKTSGGSRRKLTDQAQKSGTIFFTRVYSPTTSSMVALNENSEFQVSVILYYLYTVFHFFDSNYCKVNRELQVSVLVDC
jgi:hypothetical protein